MSALPSSQMSLLRTVRIALSVVAAPLVLVAFFFFKPPVEYFTAICLSTIAVWPVVFAAGRKRKWPSIVAGSLVQLLVQQLAYHLWLANQAGLWWPLIQFLSLQYIVALRLSPADNAAQQPHRPG